MQIRQDQAVGQDKGQSNDEPRKAPSDHESGAAEKHSYNNGRFENNDVKSSEIQKNEE